MKKRRIRSRPDKTVLQSASEKTMQKRSATRWIKSRYKTLQCPGTRGVQSRGEWVGGGANPTGGNGVETNYITLNHCSPEGWWDYESQQKSNRQQKNVAVAGGARGALVAGRRAPGAGRRLWAAGRGGWRRAVGSKNTKAP